MLKFKNLFIYLALSILVSGCSTTRQNFQVNKDFFNTPTTIVVLQTTGLEEPQFIKTGAQGILEQAINSAVTAKPKNKLKEIDTQTIVDTHYYKTSEQLLKCYSFNVIKNSELLKKEKLAKPPVDGVQYAPYDFRSLKMQYGANYALILEPKIFGVTRHYYSVMPMGRPRGYASLNLYMVNLEDNSLAGYYTTEVHTDIDGNWDSPPEYNELTTASENSLIKALDQGHKYLFH